LADILFCFDFVAVECRWGEVKAAGSMVEDLNEIEELIASGQRFKGDTLIMVEVVASFVSVVRATLILWVLWML
jgi:hypothetical protein